MRSCLKLFICIAGFLLSASADRRSEVIEFMRRENFLQRCEDEGKSVDECISDVKEFCGMQRIGGAEITDELLACIRREKCGHPVIPDRNSTRDSFFSNGALKFNKNHLTYYLLNKGTRNVLSLADTWRMVDMSVAIWACHSGLTFSRASSTQDADIFISFSDTRHGYINYYSKRQEPFDGYPFDGPGGVLAHAFFPQGYYTGNFHYDDAETYIEDKGTGIKLLHVTVHELGHNLGIHHINTLGNIMYPAYDPTFHETELDLGSLDIYQIQLRYGAKQCVNKIWQEYYDKKYPDPHRSCKDKVRSCSRYTYTECLGNRAWMKTNCARHCGFCGSCEDLSENCRNYQSCNIRDSWFLINCKKRCNYCAAKASYSKGNSSPTFRGINLNKLAICAAKKIDGIFVDEAGTLFIIVDGFIYRRLEGEQEVDPRFKLKISKFGSAGLTNPTAASYSHSSKQLYMFERSKMYVISGFEKPRAAKVQEFLMPSGTSSPSGAFIRRQRRSDVISLVKGREVITIKVKDTSVEKVKVESLAEIFDAGNYPNRIPLRVDAVYQNGKKVSFFVGSSVVEAFERKDGRLSLPGGPKPFMTTEMKCPQTL